MRTWLAILTVSDESLLSSRSIIQLLGPIKTKGRLTQQRHSPGRRDLFTDAKTGRLSTWFTRDFMGVYNRRCVNCHGKLEGTTDWNGRFAWINLTNPHLSPALTAHLAKQSGGRGIDKARRGQTPPPFVDTADPDYRAMLKAIEIGKQLTLEIPAADMQGFQGARPEP